MSSYADAARDALKAAASMAYAATVQAGKDYATAHKALVAAGDVVPAMQAAITAIMAAEHLQEAVGQAVRDLRFVLSAQMQETGATKIAIPDGPSAHLARRQAFISIDDETRIPRHFYVQPPPALDRKALKDALKAGEVPGVHLSTPNDLSLVLRSNAKEWGT